MMLRLITEEEARHKSKSVRQGYITPAVKGILGPPTGYPEAFIATGRMNNDGLEIVEAFRIRQIQDIKPGWEDARCWTGFLPLWAE